MISRRIIATIALLCTGALPAHAQKTKAALTTEINTNWPDNSAGAITPALLRSTVLDAVNSYFDLNGGTSLACAAHQWVAGLPTLSSITCTQPSISDLTGFGTGVGAALGTNVGSAGSIVVNGGALGTPSSGTGTFLTGIPISTGISGLASGIAAFLATPSSANLAAALTDETGSGSAVFGNGPTLLNPNITGTPTGAGSSITVNSTNCPLAGSCTITSGAITAGTTIVNGGPGVLQNSSSGGTLISSLTLPSGLSATNMTLTTPALGTPSAIVLTNGTLLPISTGLTGAGTGVLAGLAINVGSAGAPVLFNGAGGTPSSITLTGGTGLPLTTGVTGILPLANGGTNANLTAANGGIVYSSASGLALLAPTVTAGQCMLSGSSAPPTWGSCSGAAAVSSVTAGSAALTISPNTGAVVASLNLGNANTWTAAQTFTDGDMLLKGSTSGSMTLKAPAIASTFVMTFPAATDTVAVLGTAQTFTAAQTFTNSDLLLKGSSTGITTFTSANAGASNFTLTLPAATSTVAVLGSINQVFTANETFSGTVNISGTFQSLGNTMTFPNASVTLASLGNATLQAAPSNPTGNATTLTPKLSGMGSTCFITPNFSGRVLLQFSGSLSNTTAGDQAQAQAWWGSGTAPANGTATTGTCGTTLCAAVGTIVNGLIQTGTGQVPFANGGVITGLTPGTAYWFDEAVVPINGGTASIKFPACSAMEF